MFLSENIKKQRYYFANKGLFSQGYGFSSSHVQMWELDKKDWAPKNWCFWTVVLKKTLESLMDCSMPGFTVHHQLLELAQTHVHQVTDAVQTSHPLSSPSPPTFNPSQHQGLFKWVSSSHQVAKVLEFQLQHQSFQWTLRTDLYDRLVETPWSPRDAQASSPTQWFKSIDSLALSFLSSPTLTSIHDHRKNHSLD